jgi:hypothetical protein
MFCVFFPGGTGKLVRAISVLFVPDRPLDHLTHFLPDLTILSDSLITLDRAVPERNIDC